MIGITSSSGEPVVAPWGGTRAFLTNNPVAIAAPCGDEPVVIDMATSVAARGQILLAARTGRAIPDNWAVDENGDPTTDPKNALAGSARPMARAQSLSFLPRPELLTRRVGRGHCAPQVGSQHQAG